VLGFYLRLEDMSSPRSETQWINLSIGHRTHHPTERGDRAELSSASAEPYLLRMDSGVSVGSGGGETTREHFTVLVSSLLRGDRFEGRMQDGP
jgi:hypothetical protein